MFFRADDCPHQSERRRLGGRRRDRDRRRARDGRRRDGDDRGGRATRRGEQRPIARRRKSAQRNAPKGIASRRRWRGGWRRGRGGPVGRGRGVGRARRRRVLQRRRQRGADALDGVRRLRRGDDGEGKRLKRALLIALAATVRSLP